MPNMYNLNPLKDSPPTEECRDTLFICWAVSGVINGATKVKCSIEGSCERSMQEGCFLFGKPLHKDVKK